ncbi:MAG: HlyD family efflux transporter periplasmic adaptor subunit [Desulfohalobiaceae bacterium]|nr:HlyD family efflux transporter periplasmic adaptor subunit [Desulfohalobiaceae bacterium]
MTQHKEKSAGFDQDRLIWRQFVEASSPRTFCQSWLQLQCRMLKGVRCGMVMLGDPDQGAFSPVAFWPDAKLSMKHLSGAAKRSLKERRGLLVAGKEVNAPGYVHVAYPVEVSEKLHGVVVLEVEEPAGPERQAILRMLHWGAAWLEVMIRKDEAQRLYEITESLENVLDLVTSAVENEGFQGGAMALITRMATILECDRVSLGFMRRNRVQVKVMSHTADFGRQTNLVRAIGEAMYEALDQHAPVLYPPPPEGLPLVTRAHEELFKHHGSEAILTLPLESNGKLVGGITLERSGDKPFTQDTVEACETVAALVGPILETKQREERWLIRKAVDSGADQLSKILGPGHLLRKLILTGLAGVVIFFSLYTVDYRISAPTIIEGEVQRAVAAPFNGYIKEAPVRPGDVVKEGALICLLDDRDLRLERLTWMMEKEQLMNQYHEAMANGERAQIRITRAKIDQADARLTLIEEQLARTRVVSPFEGVVLSGDLSQSLGSPVERGQELFRVAPLDSYRVIVEVDERDISHIQEGQRSELVLPSMPGERFPFVVEKITPVSLAREGRNYFRVEAEMEKNSDRLRPGMEGVGKVTIDQRRLIWVWTHTAVDWLRLQVWRFRP